MNKKLTKEKQIQECISKMIQLVGTEHEASAKLWIEKRLRKWGKIQDLRPEKKHLCPDCMYYTKKGVNKYIHKDICFNGKSLEKFPYECKNFIEKITG